MSEYRVDELARRAGTSVRNVRVYQDRGLLPPPRRAGRVGLYSDAHLARLRLISRLLERGYTFATIGELLGAFSQGRGLAEVLGLEDALAVPWSDEQPARLTQADLERRFGAELTATTLRRAVSLGWLQREGGAFRAPSPRLLDAGAELVANGIPLSAVLDLIEELGEHMAAIARLLFATMAPYLGAEGGEPTDVEPADLLTRLRPHALTAIEAAFARAMDTQADQLIAKLAARRS